MAKLHAHLVIRSDSSPIFSHISSSLMPVVDGLPLHHYTFPFLFIISMHMIINISESDDNGFVLMFYDHLSIWL